MMYTEKEGIVCTLGGWVSENLKFVLVQFEKMWPT